MFSKRISIAVLLVSTAIFMFSCEENQPERKTEVRKEMAPSKRSASKGKVYQPSELALLMRKMYENLKVVGEQIHSEQPVSDSLLLGYEAMFTAEPTNPDEIDEKFYGFARGWIMELHAFDSNRTQENYNNLMSACVHCHESYCPGPIPKIKRLRIAPN